MSPRSRLLGVAFVWLLLGAAVALLPSLGLVWKWVGLAAAVVALFDAALVWWSRPLHVARRLPARFALGQSAEVTLTLRNDSRTPVALEVFDGIPPHAVAEVLPWEGVVPANREIRVVYPVKLVERGDAEFGAVHVRRCSPLGLWSRRFLHSAAETVKVYPNYEPVIRFALLAMQHRESPLGIVRRPRAGSSRDFHQLREYRDGDPLAQIDWKATSRRQMLISRGYQEQRDQAVVFLLDTGRRMRALDGGVPQFDHVLNALLLVAHVALGQGDQVSVKSFGGTDRWLPPIKGSHAMPVLLNHLYDYQTTAAPSDFAGAVEKLMSRQRRRSLVILLTNLRGEDGKELLPSLQVLNTKHLVLLASMREGVVQEAFHKPVDSFPSALRYLAADRYVQERREILATLGASGIFTLDSTAREFPVQLANTYFDIKAAGRI
jgi:uncharacterized protein (DUF58 family)